jgi:hypothetical protein
MKSYSDFNSVEELYEFYHLTPKMVNEAKKEETAEDIDVPDIQLHLMVEDTLKSARILTIDDLLKGFDYGLV